MNGLKIKKIIVSTSHWIGSEDLQGREVEALILSDGNALVAKGVNYSWISQGNFSVSGDVEEFSVKGGVSLVGLLGARPRTLNIDFGG